MVFAAYRWKSFTGDALYLAAALAGAFSILLDTFVVQLLRDLHLGQHRHRRALCVVSSVALGGGLSQILGAASGEDRCPLRTSRRCGRTKRV